LRIQTSGGIRWTIRKLSLRLCLEETEAFLEEILDDTDAFLDDTLEEIEGLGTTLEETDMAELDFDTITEGVIAELIIEVAIEWLSVDDTIMCGSCQPCFRLV
jgi:hypothetical protein